MSTASDRGLRSVRHQSGVTRHGKRVRFYSVVDLVSLRATPFAAPLALQPSNHCRTALVSVLESRGQRRGVTRRPILDYN